MERGRNKPTGAKRPGRPSLPKNEGKRFALGLRVTSERRQALEEAAAESGRSISQEIELRLEQSFHNEAAFGGREMLGLFRMMAGAAAMIEERRGGKTWSTDWETFQAVREAWRRIIEGVPPKMPVEWREKFAALDASRPGKPPAIPILPLPLEASRFAGLPALSDATLIDAATAEEQKRIYGQWRRASDEWTERGRQYEKTANEFLHHMESLTGLGHEIADGLLRRRYLVDALRQHGKGNRTKSEE